MLLVDVFNAVMLVGNVWLFLTNYAYYKLHHRLIVAGVIWALALETVEFTGLGAAMREWMR